MSPPQMKKIILADANRFNWIERVGATIWRNKKWDNKAGIGEKLHLEFTWDWTVQVIVPGSYPVQPTCPTLREAIDRAMKEVP